MVIKSIGLMNKNIMKIIIIACSWTVRMNENININIVHHNIMKYLLIKHN